MFEDNRLQLLPTSFATNSRMLLLHVPITVRIGSDKHQSFAFITRAGADERRYRERVTTARVASFSQMRTSQRLHGPSFTSLCAETPHGGVRFQLLGGRSTGASSSAREYRETGHADCSLSVGSHGLGGRGQ